VEYQTAYELQKRLWQQKRDGREDDILLLLEHPPTITCGKSGKLENLLVDRDELAEKGVSLFFTDRGGDITYHGPGQLVAYPIVDLGRYDKDIHRYIYMLQEVIIRTLSGYDILARRDERYVGVWCGNEKIAAIGVAVHRWVSMHGIALNVNTNLEHFRIINPCGITDKGVTSLGRVLNREIPVPEVAHRFASHFSTVFTTNIRWSTTPEE
jgi:lipoyl(octanoyl) transferase